MNTTTYPKHSNLIGNIIIIITFIIKEYYYSVISNKILHGHFTVTKVQNKNKCGTISIN